MKSLVCIFMLFCTTISSEAEQNPLKEIKTQQDFITYILKDKQTSLVLYTTNTSLSDPVTTMVTQAARAFAGKINAYVIGTTLFNDNQGMTKPVVIIFQNGQERIRLPRLKSAAQLKQIISYLITPPIIPSIRPGCAACGRSVSSDVQLNEKEGI